MIMKAKRITVIILCLSLIFSCSGVASYAAGIRISGGSSISQMTASAGRTTNNLSVRIYAGSSLIIDFKSSLSAKEYRTSLVKIKKTGHTWYKTLGYSKRVNGGFKATYSLKNIGDGNYYLVIKQARTTAQMKRSAYGDGGECYKNMIITVTNGCGYIKQYTKVMTNNTKVQNAEQYMNKDYFLNPDLSDMSFALKTSASGEVAKRLTTDEMKYIKRYADRVVRGKNSSYAKARAVYKSVGSMFYYDNYAFEQNKELQYPNPYVNLRNYLRKSSSASSTNGKVATVCTGYAALAIAMLRAEGIPARFVHGYHINPYKESWESASLSTAEVEEKGTHYWVEFYDRADRKWKTLDARVASKSCWDRKSAKDKGEWKSKGGFSNYTYFDPSPEQLAVSHYEYGVYSKCIVYNPNDASKLYAFLENNNNRQLLGGSKKVNPDGIYSWDTDIFYTDAKTGEMRGFRALEKPVSGIVDFSSMEKLLFVNFQNTQVDEIIVDDCGSLEKIYASNSNIKKLSAVGSNNLKEVYALGSPLKEIRFSFNGNNTAEINADEGGFVGITTKEDQYKIVAYPDSNYKFVGWENKDGELVSTKKPIYMSNSESFDLTAKFAAE